MSVEQKCRICGCTWDNACPGGCYWVEPDLCSKCADVSADNKNKKRDCYVPNDSPYPLCIGNGSSACKKCCLYEDMDESPFEK